MIRTQRRDDPRPRFLNAGELEGFWNAFSSRLGGLGYSPLSIEGYRASVAHFGHWMASTGATVCELDEPLVERFSNHRCRCPGGRRRRSMSRRYVARVRRFVDYLRTCGVVRELVQPPAEAPTLASLAQFRHWLVEHRGLSERTVAGYEHWLRQLAGPLGVDPAQYTARHVRDVIRTEARQRGFSATRGMTTALRGYLRFLAAHGACQAGLDAAIPPLWQWRLSSLPRYLSGAEVDGVIASCDCRTMVGARNRAILLLLARLGLRAGDIVDMRLEDLDWGQGLLRVRGKSRSEVRLPLTQEVGEAILDYLDRSRPGRAAEQVFLCAQAPSRPFASASAISSIVRAALHRAGITDPPSRGAHLLRHSAATGMLRQGASLEVIASILRHRSTDMTGHYAKVDLGMLALVTQPWPEGMPC